jgi:hypothetical protein
MRNVIAVVCLVLLPTFVFAQQKALPSPPPQADNQPPVDSICEGTSSNLLVFVNCGFETGDFTDWTVGGDTTYASVGTNTVNSGNYAAGFGAIGNYTVLNQQIFTSRSGDTFHVEFWLTNPVGGAGTEFQFYWYPSPNDDPVLLMDVTDSDPFDWTLFTFGPLPATDSGATLSFLFRHDPDFFYFDDLDVELAQ